MQVAVLGPLEVRTDDLAPVPVPGAEERLLLAVLVAGAPAPVSTDRLIDALWNGRAAGSADESLRVHVAACAAASNRVCRRVERAVRRPPRTGLPPRRARADIDALRMTSLVERGSARLAAGDAADAARLLSSALDCGGATRTPTGRTPPSRATNGAAWCAARAMPRAGSGGAE